MPTINKKFHRYGFETAEDTRKTWSYDTGEMKFYNSGAWRKLRRFVLQKNPFCVECEKKGVQTVATDVDHITPIRLGGERLNEDNLQGLCKTCHRDKTRQERWGK